MGRQDRRRRRRGHRLDHPRPSGVQLPAGDARARVRRQGLRPLRRERLPDDAGAAQGQRRHRRRRPRDVQTRPAGHELDGRCDARAVGHAGDGGHGHAHGVRGEELGCSLQRRAGTRRRARLGVPGARVQARVLLGRRRQRREGPGWLYRWCKEARQRRRRLVPAGGELRAGRADATVPPDELRREGREEELPPGAIVHLEGRVLHHLLQPCSVTGDGKKNVGLEVEWRTIMFREKKMVSLYTE